MSKELAADYFSRHQGDQCHITTDGRVFHTIGAADSFASSLKDKKVTSYTREEIQAIPTESETPIVEDTGEKEDRFVKRVDILLGLGFQRIQDNFINSASSGTISVQDVFEISDELFDVSIAPVVMDNSKIEALETLKNFDLKTASYQDAKALVKALALETPSKSQEDLLIAIAAQKAIINTEINE